METKGIMTPALILKSDVVYVCRLPEEPKKWDYESGGDPPEISPYVMPDYYYHLEEYNAAKEKAIQEAVLCADQEQAKAFLLYVKSDTPYIIPGLDFEVTCNRDCQGSCFHPSNCDLKTKVAILLLPKQEENEQDLKDKIEFIKGAFQCYVGYENTDGLKKFLNESHYTISKKL